MSVLPRYPIYVPSKGRWDPCHTARELVADGVPFNLVVVPAEAEVYANRFPEANLLVLPSDDLQLLGTRNWIRDHAEASGAKRHWQLDDNIRAFHRVYGKERLYCEAGVALRVCEDLSDKYLNVGISGLNYTMFAPARTQKMPPFVKNCHVYSCSLINHEMPYRWRRIYNDDTDICLQALASGYWTTLLLNAFLADKLWTMLVPGGNTDDLYRFTDGRLKMARSLERDWPGVVETKRRFQRPQHVVKYAWKKFDTALIPNPDWKPPEDPEYGMSLNQKGPIKSRRVQSIKDQWDERT